MEKTYVVLLAIMICCLWGMREINSGYIKTLQTQTIPIQPSEVRQLMSDCKGVFKIHQDNIDGQLTFTVECQL